MGVANNYACYRQLYRLVPVLFIPVQQFHPTCSYTFYTCSTLYLFKFFGGKFLYVYKQFISIRMHTEQLSYQYTNHIYMYSCKYHNNDILYMDILHSLQREVFIGTHWSFWNISPFAQKLFLYHLLRVTVKSRTENHLSQHALSPEHAIQYQKTIPNELFAAHQHNLCPFRKQLYLSQYKAFLQGCKINLGSLFSHLPQCIWCTCPQDGTS